MSQPSDPGGATERERLIKSHLPLVKAIARRYEGRGETLEDLIQVGALALIRASDRFDPRRGVAFGTFAAPAVEGEIRHFPLSIPWRAVCSLRRSEGNGLCPMSSVGKRTWPLSEAAPLRPWSKVAIKKGGVANRRRRDRPSHPTCRPGRLIPGSKCPIQVWNSMSFAISAIRQAYWHIPPGRILWTNRDARVACSFVPH